MFQPGPVWQASLTSKNGSLAVEDDGGGNDANAKLRGRLPADGSKEAETNHIDGLSILRFDAIHDGAGRQAGRSEGRMKLK